MSEKEIEEKIESDDLDKFLSVRIAQETKEAGKQCAEVKDRHGELKKRYCGADRTSQ